MEFPARPGKHITCFNYHLFLCLHIQRLGAYCFTSVHLSVCPKLNVKNSPFVGAWCFTNTSCLILHEHQEKDYFLPVSL